MSEHLVAIATDDGTNLIPRHFGDARYYDIYSVGPSGHTFVTRINNRAADMEEESHADPRKAKGVAGQLKEHKVGIVASKVFGPNVRRIKESFICVLLSLPDIPSSLDRIHEELLKEGSFDQWSESRIVRLRAEA